MATSTTDSSTPAGKKSILFVFTSASKIGPVGNQIETGYWISEGGNLVSVAVGVVSHRLATQLRTHTGFSTRNSTSTLHLRMVLTPLSTVRASKCVPSRMISFHAVLILGQFHKDDYGSNKFLNDEEVKSKLATAKALSQVVASE
jgi:hypothetical protein